MSAPISTRVKGKEVAEQIPDDVIEQILVRLPVKSVLRFRCACKTWYSFFSDPKFSKLHQIRTCILICTNKLREEFSTINIESLLSERDDGTAPTPTPLFPLRLFDADDNCKTDGCCTSQFLGSSNGLICVDQKCYHIPDRRGLILWNPSTRKIKRLPPPRRSPAFITYAGFGYDESVDDYKLVWVRHPKHYDVGQVITELDVYSLKSNTWSIHPPLNISFVHNIYYGCYGNCVIYGVLSNGSIHWVVDRYRDSSQVSSQGKHIVAFDLATEKFRFMAIPPGVGSVRSLEGSLCSYYCDWRVKIDLWVMKEYGVDSSWTKLVSISYMSLCRDGYYIVYPVLFSKEEIVAVVRADYRVKMVKFNIQNRDVEFETLSSVSEKPINGLSGYLLDAVLHVESLVSLGEDATGPTQCLDNDQPEKGKAWLIYRGKNGRRRRAQWKGWNEGS